MGLKTESSVSQSPRFVFFCLHLLLIRIFLLIEYSSYIGTNYGKGGRHFSPPPPPGFPKWMEVISASCPLPFVLEFILKAQGFLLWLVDLRLTEGQNVLPSFRTGNLNSKQRISISCIVAAERIYGRFWKIYGHRPKLNRALRKRGSPCYIGRMDLMYAGWG